MENYIEISEVSPRDGIQNEKVLTKDIIEKVVTEVEKKASELENQK